jgi:hypothetical protein
VKAWQCRQPLRRAHDQLLPVAVPREAASPSTVTKWMVSPCRFRSTDLVRGQPDGLTVLGCRTGQGRSVSRTLARAAAVADRRVTGLSREVLAELGPRWQARRADRPRQRAIGAGARHRLVFVDRLLATLVHLGHGVTGSRGHGVTHDVLTCWLGVPRSTITRAVGEVRPLLAERGCTVEDGIRLHTRADVIAHPGCQRAAWPAGCHRGEGAPPGGPQGRPD